MKPRKFLKYIVILTIFIVLTGVIFIKIDTPGAALFTDNYLRPLLGNTFVGFLEKTYYNTADKIQQIVDKTGIRNQPQFINEGIQSSIAPIQIAHGLPKISGEGIWKVHPLTLFPGRNVMDYTFVRPDPARPFAYVTLVMMDMTKMNLSAVAGTKQPGGPIGNPGPGKIPGNIVSGGKLIAAFDGGFQYRDGMYGMIVDGKTYLPLRTDVGTLVGYKDGTLKIVNYIGQDLGKNIAFIRQNCPILIENGQIFALNEMNKKLWGRTFNADIFTWRSGIGLTAQGNLIYAVGNNLSPESLANALNIAGAVNAIQLDINPFWVRFNIFDSNGNGTYKVSTLTRDLKDGSNAYLNGYSKDFFFLSAK